MTSEEVKTLYLKACFDLTRILLFVMFVGLKLASLLDWTWWAVDAPIWAPFCLQLFMNFLRGFFRAFKLAYAKARIAREMRRRQSFKGKGR